MDSAFCVGRLGRMPQRGQLSRYLLHYPRQGSFSDSSAPNQEDLGLLDRVSDGVLASLERPGPSLEEVASSMGVNERTVRRRLDRMGLPWRRLLDEVRATVLESERTTRTVTSREAARLLGFANEGAMRRAVRRWTASVGRSGLR